MMKPLKLHTDLVKARPWVDVNGGVLRRGEDGKRESSFSLADRSLPLVISRKTYDNMQDAKRGGDVWILEHNHPAILEDLQIPWEEEE